MKIFQNENGEEVTIPDEVFNKIRQSGFSEGNQKATADLIKNFKGFALPENADKMRSKELTAFVADTVKQQLDEIQKTSQSSIEKAKEKTELDMEQRVAQIIAKDRAELNKEREQIALKSFRKQILAQAISNQLNPKQKLAYDAYIDGYFEIKFQDGEAVAYDKEGVLVLGGIDEIEKKIRSEHTEAYQSLKPGAGAGKINGTGLPAQKIDLSSGANNLIASGILAGELPQAEDNSKTL